MPNFWGQFTRPLANTLHAWMIAQRQQLPEGSTTARAIDYSLKRWVALTRYIDDVRLPADNNWIENQIRPVACRLRKSFQGFCPSTGVRHARSVRGLKPSSLR